MSFLKMLLTVELNRCMNGTKIDAMCNAARVFSIAHEPSARTPFNAFDSSRCALERAISRPVEFSV